MPLPHNVPQCQHVKINGIRCGSPSLRGHHHCFYHSSLRVVDSRPSEIAWVEDATSVQVALMQVIKGVSRQNWDTKRSALLLYALQIASSNLKQIRQERLVPSVLTARAQAQETICELPHKNEVETEAAMQGPIAVDSETVETETQSVAVPEAMPAHEPLPEKFAPVSSFDPHSEASSHANEDRMNGTNIMSNGKVHSSARCLNLRANAFLKLETRNLKLLQ